MHYSIKIIICVSLFATLLGCAFNKPQGSSFHDHALKDPEKILVYIYRPEGEKFGWDRTYYLHGRDGKIVDLKHGGYFSFEIDPGEFILAAGVNKTLRMMVSPIGYAIEASSKEENKETAILKFEAEKGKTYYVRFTPVSHSSWFEPTLTIVTEAQGRPELRKTRRIVSGGE